MREFEFAGGFKRDYKREKKGHHRATVVADVEAVLALLAADVALEAAYNDHDLSGDWAGYRECHIKPDLLLIYSKAVDGILRLSRLGSHSELF